MKIVAVTACPTGIAHTYMAADALKKEAKNRNLAIKIATWLLKLKHRAQWELKIR